MFQIIMNEILQDLINTEEVVSFTEDMIVRIKEEAEHNEVVKKVKMLSENNFYMKLEKCK